MASNLANLVFSAIGAIAKPNQPAPAKTVDRSDDRFARLIEALPNATRRNQASPPQADNPAIDKTAATKGTLPSEAPADTAEAASGHAGSDNKSEQSLGDVLLAALAALGVETGETVKGEGAEVTELADIAELVDPAALKEIEGAITELSQLLGLDPAALVQQLAGLVEGVAAGAGAGLADEPILAGLSQAVAGEGDLVKKLSSWLGERLGAAGGLLPAEAEATIAKLVEGLGQLAKPVPNAPELGTAELKLTEPVLTGKTAEAAADAAEPDLAKEAEGLLRSLETGKASESTDNQTAKSQAGLQHAARTTGAQEMVQNLTLTQAGQADPAQLQTETVTTPRVVQTGYQTSQQQLNLPQIAFELSRQVMDGNSRFQIRLDPPELGRIDVKLDIDSNGQVHAKLVVDKAETLDLMQRDQRALERALQQAGLDQAKTSLEFSLKQNPFAGDKHQNQDGQNGSVQSGQDGGEEIDTPAPAITLYRGALQASGVNIIA